MPTTKFSIALAEIEQAQQRIGQLINFTSLSHSTYLSERTGHGVYLKLENQQVTGSFKLRGAANAIANLSAEQRHQGVVTASTGNHGRALAFVARRFQIRCVICLSSTTPQNKIDAIRETNAEVRFAGNSQDHAESEAQRIATEEKMTFVPPFDDLSVIAGQGTIGLELLQQLPQISTVVVPVSGGGLVSGIALALKSNRSNIRVIGVSMSDGAAMHACLKAGRIVEVEEKPTLADALQGNIGLNNRFTFAMTKTLIDEFVTVSEDQITEAIHHAYWHERLILEGSGSVAIAALLSGKITIGGPCVVIMSGGNIDMTIHQRIVSKSEQPSDPLN